jgi:multidrug transporter EmrE-like cation transporter
MMHWTLILLAAAANVVLNLCLRQTARGLDVSTPQSILLSVLGSPWSWAAMVSGLALLGLFVAAVRTFPLSLTYTAVTALAMVALTALGVILQLESVSAIRVAGLGLIVAGLMVTAWAT